MATINHPSKEDIREWMFKRRHERQPLPDVEQIQRELNWSTSKDRLERNVVIAPKAAQV